MYRFALFVGFQPHMYLRRPKQYCGDLRRRRIRAKAAQKHMNILARETPHFRATAVFWDLPAVLWSRESLRHIIADVCFKVDLTQKRACSMLMMCSSTLKQSNQRACDMLRMCTSRLKQSNQRACSMFCLCFVTSSFKLHSVILSFSGQSDTRRTVMSVPDSIIPKG